MKVKVKNRSNGYVVYTLPEDGVRREFAPGETRTVEDNELERLTYRPGGRELIRDYLLIDSKETVENLINKVEPEYWLTDEQVITLIKTGSLEEFQDCLDYAPVGVLDIIKKYAVSLPMNDRQKVEAMKKQIGFDLESALRLIEEEKKDDDAAPVEESASTSGRRVKPKTEETASRRVEPKYKVVSREG